MSVRAYRLMMRLRHRRSSTSTIAAHRTVRQRVALPPQSAPASDRGSADAEPSRRLVHAEVIGSANRSFAELDGVGGRHVKRQLCRPKFPYGTQTIRFLGYFFPVSTSRSAAVSAIEHQLSGRDRVIEHDPRS